MAHRNIPAQMSTNASALPRRLVPITCNVKALCAQGCGAPGRTVGGVGGAYPPQPATTSCTPRPGCQGSWAICCSRYPLTPATARPVGSWDPGLLPCVGDNRELESLVTVGWLVWCGCACAVVRPWSRAALSTASCMRLRARGGSKAVQPARIGACCLEGRPGRSGTVTWHSLPSRPAERSCHTALHDAHSTGLWCGVGSLL